MIDFFRRLFGHSGSSSAAKERLRLVLMTDHLELSPEIVDSMKRDLMDVISRYVEVDRDKIDVSFERQDNALAMLANIPILAVNRAANGHAPAPVAVAPAVVAPEAIAPAVETPATADEAQPSGDEVGAQPSGDEVGAQSADDESAGDELVAADAAAQPPATGTDLKRRRRRRKRKTAPAADATQPALP